MAIRPPPPAPPKVFGAKVGILVGNLVGSCVGLLVTVANVGMKVGFLLKAIDGAPILEGKDVGLKVGDRVGISEPEKAAPPAAERRWPGAVIRERVAMEMDPPEPAPAPPLDCPPSAIRREVLCRFTNPPFTDM